MATLRTFILNQSTLPTGNLVRDHLKNPSTGGPGGSLILSDGLEVIMDDDCFDIELDLSPVLVEIDDGVIVEIETEEFEIELC